MASNDQGPRPLASAPAALLANAVQFGLRHYPLYRGHGRIANGALGVLASPPASDGGDVAVRLRSGPLIYVQPDEYVGRTVSLFGDLDPKVSWVCNRLLRLGDTFVDVGANCGVVSLLGAHLVGPSGEVHAFEPQPESASSLRRSAAANGFGQLQVHEVALSDVDGWQELVVPLDNLGAASLSRTPVGPSRSVGVSIRQSGPYLSRLDLGPVRLLKLDIEGHEEQLLAGALDYLGQHPPEAIVFESNEDPRPFWLRPSVQSLADLGYRLAAIDRTLTSAFRMQLRHLTTGTEPGRSLDFVAIHSRHWPPIAARLGIRT